ncbi:MAG: NAD(P)-binding protein [Rhizobiales bacterium]|nr:NAD(P)-binding protein [Hyphomicrobiales bacterium]
MTAYRNLLSPITIKGRTFRNRVFSSSHAPGYADSGLPGDRYQAYHEEKARGGIGLTMFGGSSNVSRDSGSIYGQIYVGDDRVIPAFRAMSKRVHAHGAGLMCQITHMGRRTTWDAGDWLPTKGPSALRDPAHHSMPYALSTREIARIVKAFADGARRCREGGLDGVEILGSAHILGQFLSPIGNRRSDSYGGNLDNRARFLVEVIEAVRGAVGDDFLVSVRTNFDESNEAGLTPEEGIEVARILGKHGATDILNVNGAYGGTHMGLAEYMPAMGFPSAPYIELARRVREASGLVTFQAARLADPATADWAIGAGHVDMAGMTRAHMADPEIVAKIMRGEENRIRPCVGAGYCGDRIYVGRDALCQHNVSTGRESWLPSRIERAATPLGAVVVGGGPAGMEAARVLALRGHRVTLLEAGSRLGGQILLAAKGGWRKDLIGIADWLAAEVENEGVDVRLDTYAEVDDILALEPDVVIVATGGVPETSLALGGQEFMLTVWDVLGGQAEARGETLVFDAVGGHAALSAADRLSSEGVKVVVATSDRHIGRAINGNNAPVYLRNLGRAGVSIMTDVALVGLERDGNRLRALLRHAFTREIEARTFDTVVADLGTRSVTDLSDALSERSRNFGEFDYEALATLRPQPVGENSDGIFQLYRIGDALTARDIHAALLEANRLCRVI